MARSPRPLSTDRAGAWKRLKSREKKGMPPCYFEMKGTWFCKAQSPMMNASLPSLQLQTWAIFRILKKSFLIEKKM